TESVQGAERTQNELLTDVRPPCSTESCTRVLKSLQRPKRLSYRCSPWIEQNKIRTSSTSVVPSSERIRSRSLMSDGIVEDGKTLGFSAQMPQRSTIHPRLVTGSVRRKTKHVMSSCWRALPTKMSTAPITSRIVSEARPFACKRGRRRPSPQSSPHALPGSPRPPPNHHRVV